MSEISEINSDILTCIDFKIVATFLFGDTLFNHFDNNKIFNESLLTMSYPIHSQCTLSLPPENIRKLYGFFMFSGSRERVHLERMD